MRLPAMAAGNEAAAAAAGGGGSGRSARESSGAAHQVGAQAGAPPARMVPEGRAAEGAAGDRVIMGAEGAAGDRVAAEAAGGQARPDPGRGYQGIRLCLPEEATVLQYPAPEEAAGSRPFPASHQPVRDGRATNSVNPHNGRIISGPRHS
jgi:hypothetical protein